MNVNSARDHMSATEAATAGAVIVVEDVAVPGEPRMPGAVPGRIPAEAGAFHRRPGSPRCSTPPGAPAPCPARHASASG
ncbi:hypothetical protein HUT06_24585 [Actinomadura sp. NAK00032]|uniref:hypothetical protein n=1 Tax=Actinomadura sp. NAK00032 TaxID=2742128 RepID=UPI00158FEA19|nr:hypothetical protein [Actinomadura sp. NAK00032]QKW36811.1 hypothetical protein HUT06_24585 [Actinomadura sp. NAK00032]